MSETYESLGHKSSVCQKIGYPSKEIADRALWRIKHSLGRNKKPTRSYECDDCHEWHLTSLPYGRYKASKDFEQRNSNNFTLQYQSRWEALFETHETDHVET